MKKIPSGFYSPLYLDAANLTAQNSNAKSKIRSGQKIAVAPFLLDVHAVTRADYLRFLVQHSEWQRSQIKRIFADANYLNDWPEDLQPGVEQDGESPVRYVSWFAARAYCKSFGKRLPTLAEWEYAASAFKNEKNLSAKILDWYSRANPKKLPKVESTFQNDFGIYDLHGLVWEWVEDFNSALVTGESRGNDSLDRNLFCGAGAFGANDFKDYAAFMRFAFRSSLSGSFSLSNLGFRCARDI